MALEFCNKIELKGVVGRADIDSFNERRVCNCSVVTQTAFRDKSGNSIVEPMFWFVVAWEDALPKSSCSIDDIRKGQWVHIIGRLRIRTRIDDKGNERSVPEVIANRVELIPQEG